MKRYSDTGLEGSEGFSQIVQGKQGNRKFRGVALYRFVKMGINRFYLSSAALGADISRHLAAMRLALSVLRAGTISRPSAGAAHCARGSYVCILGAEQRSRSRNKANASTLGPTRKNLGCPEYC